MSQSAKLKFILTSLTKDMEMDNKIFPYYFFKTKTNIAKVIEKKREKIAIDEVLIVVDYDDCIVPMLKSTDVLHIRRNYICIKDPWYTRENLIEDIQCVCDGAGVAIG